MKKFLRHLFSGYTFVLFILLLEICFFIFLQFFLDDIIKYFLTNTGHSTNKVRGIVYFIYFMIRVIIFIIGLIIFFKIVNKSENPEFKIPWIVGMLLMPLFTSVVYLIFGNHGLRKMDRVIIDATRKAYDPYFQLNKDVKEEYVEQLGKAYGTFKYINNVTKLGVHKNNRLTYYKCGEEFFPAFKEALKQAKEFIFMEFFIIADGKEWGEVQEILIQKAKAGVDVRIIYDDMGCGSTISSKTPKILANYGIKCYKFHPFRPILSGVYNNRDHRKIVVVDHRFAFTGGINLADEYANEIVRFGYWKDTMVRIEGSAINNLIVTFLQNYNLCTHRVSNYAKYLNYEYPKFEDEGFLMPFGDGPGDIDKAQIGEQTYINILNYAQRKVYISTPYLVPTYGLIDALRNAALRGVEVHLIVPGIPDKKIVYAMAKSNFAYLLEAGVHIYTYKPGFNHMKSALADDELGFVGTINFDFRSLVHHFECGTILYKCNCMTAIRDDFEQMISVSEKVPGNFKMRKGRRICAVLKIFSALF